MLGCLMGWARRQGSGLLVILGSDPPPPELHGPPRTLHGVGVGGSDNQKHISGVSQGREGSETGSPRRTWASWPWKGSLQDDPLPSAADSRAGLGPQEQPSSACGQTGTFHIRKDFLVQCL